MLRAACSRYISTVSSAYKFRVLFMGQDDFSCTILKHIYNAPDVWEDIWVATNPNVTTSRRFRDSRAAPLRHLAQSLNLKTRPVPQKELGLKGWETPQIFHDELASPRNVLITASFGRLIPLRILETFHETRRLNVHPSLLPLYRGPAPIQQAIMDGQSTTGVSIISLNRVGRGRGFDTGDIWASDIVDIPPDSTFLSLRDTLADKGGKLLVATLRAMSAGTAKCVSQLDENASLAPEIKASTAQVDWNTWDAYRVKRVDRAASYLHPCMTVLPYSPTLQLKEFDVHSPPAGLHPKLKEPGDAVFNIATKSIIIRCANQTEISVTRLQQAGKRHLGAADFWNGIRPNGLQNDILKLRPFSSEQLKND